MLNLLTAETFLKVQHLLVRQMEFKYVFQGIFHPYAKLGYSQDPAKNVPSLEESQHSLCFCSIEQLTRSNDNVYSGLKSH